MSQPVCTVVQVPYLVDSDQDGDVALKCNNVEGGQLYPEEVSGQILAHMLAHAEQSMQASISKAVISVRSISSMFTCVGAQTPMVCVEQAKGNSICHCCRYQHILMRIKNMQPSQLAR